MTDKLTPQQEAFVQHYAAQQSALGAAAASGIALREQPAARWYVYLLIDPLTGRIFYVGKGSGQRMRMHARRAGSAAERNVEKAERILAIRAAGSQVLERVFADLDEEAAAYGLERALIERLQDHDLTNRAPGQRTARELAIERAQLMLARMLPLEAWLRQKRTPLIAAFEEQGGDLRALYALLRKAVEDQIENPTPRTVVVDRKGEVSYLWH